VFLNSFRKGLPKCKVAHSIRQSHLYKTGKNPDVYSKIAEKYPLLYYYIRKEYITSFYYSKNDLILYYIHSMKNNNFRVVPLYNYVKNDYEIILTSLAYNFMNHTEICVVKAPNRQIYTIGIVSKPLIIENVSKGTILYDFDNKITYLFHSMPIANSFVLVIMNSSREILIHVVDLIKEKTYTQKYPIEKIIETILSLSEVNDIYYQQLKTIKISDKLSFDRSVENSVNNSLTNFVFYDRCLVKVSISFENTKTGNKKTLKNVLSIVAIYQDNELTVSLQINDNINLETPNYNYQINFAGTKILASNKYKMDSKYDISQSHLYSVIASAGNYTIISESNMTLNTVVLYYKNQSGFIFSDIHLDIYNYGDILSIRAFNKRLVFANKNRLINLKSVNGYYIDYKEPYINIIDTKVVRNLILENVDKNNNKDLFGIDITDKMEVIHLKDKLQETIRRYVCSNDNFVFFFYTHYIDQEAREFYSLIYFQCLERVGNNEFKPGKYRIYLFRDTTSRLLSNQYSLRLVGKFETDEPPKKIPSVLHTQAINGNRINTYNMILRLLSNKWSTGNGFIDMKVFQIYEKTDAYYDYRYNRRSITASPINTSVASTLHLVRLIKQILF